MKRFLLLIFAMIAITFQSIAQESESSSSTKTVGLEVHKKHNNASQKVHRIPMQISIEAYYDDISSTLNINYDGELPGEVFLYLNESVVDYSSQINTSFLIPSFGLYRVEIISENWIAEGYLLL